MGSRNYPSLCLPSDYSQSFETLKMLATSVITSRRMRPAPRPNLAVLITRHSVPLTVSQCLLWVISRHNGTFASCPHYPR